MVQAPDSVQIRAIPGSDRSVPKPQARPLFFFPSAGLFGPSWSLHGLGVCVSPGNLRVPASVFPVSCFLFPIPVYQAAALVPADLRPRRKKTAAPMTTTAMPPIRRGDMPLGSPTEKGKRETSGSFSVTVTRPTNLPGWVKLYSKLMEPLG